MQFNLAVGFALREEWEKASNIVTQLYRDGQDVSVQVCHVPENCQILRNSLYDAILGVASGALPLPENRAGIN